MPAPTNTIDDFSDSFIQRIEKCCETGKLFRFNVYSKKYKYEKSTSNSGIKVITINPNNFDNDPEKVADEVIRIRKKIRKENKTYIPTGALGNGKSGHTTLINPELIMKVKGLAKYGITQLSDINLYLPKTGASTVASMGSGQTGKSTLLRYIANKYYLNKDHINILYTMSANIKLYGNLDEFIEVRHGFNSGDEAGIEMQKYINSKRKNNEMIKFMNFFDDIIDNKYSATVDKMILVYRNQLISTWLSTQYPYLISKKNRNNINSFILFRFHVSTFLEQVIKDYLKPYFIKILGKNANMDDMIQLYMDATDDHGFIYISPFEDRIEFIRLSDDIVSKL